MNILLMSTGMQIGIVVAFVIGVIIAFTIAAKAKKKPSDSPNTPIPGNGGINVVIPEEQGGGVISVPPPVTTTPSPGGSKGSFIARERQKIIDTLEFVTKSPLGVNILAHRPIKPMFITAIDDAFIMQQRMVLENGLTKVSNPETSKVYVFPNVENEIEKYGPAFKAFFAPGDPYDGSSSDQDKENPGGWVFAAEQVLSYEPVEIIVAHYEKNWGSAKRAVYNGLDHVALEINGTHREIDRTHQNGQSFHPLRPVSGYNDNYPEDLM